MASYPGALNPAPNVVFVPVPAQQWTSKNEKKYSKMKAIPAVRTFAILSIIIGLASIGIQIALLCYLWYTYGTYDVVGHGIWAGVFYVICGGLCLGAASKKTKGLIISSLVFACLSAASATAASVLSGLSTSFHCTGYYVTCNMLYSLHWSLMGFSIYAFCNSVVLIALMSVALSSGKPKNSGQNISGQPAAYFTPGGFPQGWQPNLGAVNVGFQGFVAPPSGVHAVSIAPAVPSSREHVDQQVERQVQPAASCTGKEKPTEDVPQLDSSTVGPTV